MDNPTVGATFDTRFGGLPSRVINGDGERNGRNIRFSIVMVDLPGSRIALMVGLATPDAADGVIDEINNVFRSIKAGR